MNKEIELKEINSELSEIDNKLKTVYDKLSDASEKFRELIGVKDELIYEKNELLFIEENLKTKRDKITEYYLDKQSFLCANCETNEVDYDDNIITFMKNEKRITGKVCIECYYNLEEVK